MNTKEDTKRLIDSLFNDRINDFIFDWDNSQSFDFEIDIMTKKDMENLINFFGDMEILVAPSRVETLLVRVYKKR